MIRESPTEAPPCSRSLFAACNGVLFLLHVFLVSVAYLTGGETLFEAPKAIYAAIGPAAFFLAAMIVILARLPERTERWVAITAFALSIPAITHSFMYFGILIVPLSAYWIVVTFDESKAEESGP